jgi:hypothetical protein
MEGTSLTLCCCKETHLNAHWQYLNRENVWLLGFPIHELISNEHLIDFLLWQGDAHRPWSSQCLAHEVHDSEYNMAAAHERACNVNVFRRALPLQVLCLRKSLEHRTSVHLNPWQLLLRRLLYIWLLDGGSGQLLPVSSLTAAHLQIQMLLLHASSPWPHIT